MLEFNNPYCRCNQHLGKHNHTTAEHKYAVAEMEDDHDDSVRTISEETVDAVALWCGGRSVIEHDAADYSKTYPALNVPTTRGVERASEGDSVIRHDDGSFTVVRG